MCHIKSKNINAVSSENIKYTRYFISTYSLMNSVSRDTFTQFLESVDFECIFLLKCHEILLNFCSVVPVFECSIKISPTFTKLLYVFDIYKCIPFEQNKFEENWLRRSTRSSQPNQSVLNPRV